MAFQESIKSLEIQRWIPGSQFFWNIHESVGYTCMNNQSDVMLIQFLLNSCNRGENKTNRLLVPDGKFGGKTWRQIKNFQEQWSMGVGQTSDGCVKSVDGTRLTSPRTGTDYTIICLNHYYREFRSIYYSDIRRDPNIPKPLIPKILGLPAVV